MTTSYTYDYQNHLTAMENRTGSSGVISRYTSEYLVNGQKAKEASDVTGRDGKKSTKTAAYTYDLPVTSEVSFAFCPFTRYSELYREITPARSVRFSIAVRWFW